MIIEGFKRREREVKGFIINDLDIGSWILKDFPRRGEGYVFLFYIVSPSYDWWDPNGVNVLHYSFSTLLCFVPT